MKTIRRISDVLKVSSQMLESKGVLDAFIDLDSRLHIDPFLLRQTTVPELCNSFNRFQNYFQNIISILEASETMNDRFFREAAKRLQFPECPGASLGYSKSAKGGRGVGPKTAFQLAQTAKQIIDAGVKSPVMFELVGLIEEGIGADFISDMTLRIILEDIFAYTDRVSEELEIKTRPVFYQSKRYGIPTYPKVYSAIVNKRLRSRKLRLQHEPILFIPIEILRSLPVAHDWDDIDTVCAYNENLRVRVNKLIGSSWKHATTKISKKLLRDVLISNPGAIRDLIEQYESKESTAYDFKNDPAGYMKWKEIADQYSGGYPLELPRPNKSDPETVFKVVLKICDHFKKLVETNGLWAAFYDDVGKRRHERFAQLLFFAISDSYCHANNIDISREPNAGKGPVDFKFSSGYKSRITVEVKYSTNSRLKHGFTQQLPAYNTAERSSNSVYLVVRTSDSEKSIDSIRKIRNEAIGEGLCVPEMIVVDGRVQKTASKT